jgi:2-polyprenyl-3-methyl-5-hydroxy-6-metoxy-1,4-benzoquinol methylase
MIIPNKLRGMLAKETAENHRRITELCKKYFKNKESKILDVGSGDGKLLNKIAKSTKINPKNFNCVELDTKYKKVLQNYGFNVKSFDLNTKFPYKDNSFDYVIANQIIEHLYFTDYFVEEIRRILKPGGLMILSTTNLVAIHSRLIMLLGFMPNSLHPSTHIVGTLIQKKGNNPIYGHKSVFSARALKQFTKLHGFKVLLSESQSILLVPRLLSKLICKVFDFGTHINIVGKKQD